MKLSLLVFFIMPFLTFGQIQLGDAFIDYRNSNTLDDEGNTIAVTRDISEFYDAIEVFDYINDEWALRQDNIGFTGRHFQLSADGNVIILSRPSFNISEVAVYFWDGTSWNSRGDIFSFDPEAPIQVGSRILINDDGNRIFIENGFEDILVYDWNGNSWDLTDTVIGIGGNNNIAINSDGSRLAYTIFTATNSTISDYMIRVLQLQNGVFEPLGNDITNPLLQLNGVFNVLDFSTVGNRLVVASPAAADFNTSAGAFAVYEFSNSTWSLIGDIVTGQNAFENFGSDVAMNASGNRVAVGIISSNVFGQGSGETKLFEFNSNEWQEIASVSGRFAGSQSGSDVDINGNGDIISIGENSVLPQVRVFEINELSVNEFNKINIHIYPNPTHDFVHINVKTSGNLNIVDINGKQIINNITLSEGTNKIAIKDLTPGLYFLKLLIDSKPYISKLMVN